MTGYGKHNQEAEMEASQFSTFGIPALIACLVCACGRPPEKAQSPLVRIAELEIDPAQLEAYKAALRRKSRLRFGWNPEF